MKDDMLEREASLAFWGDFLYEVNYNRSVILNRERNETLFPAYTGQEGRDVPGPGK